MDERLRRAERELNADDSPDLQAQVQARRARLGPVVPWGEQWEVQGEIARFGGGYVYRIRNAETQQEQALRVFDLGPEWLQARRRLRCAQRVELQQRVVHPAVPAVYATGLCSTQGGRPGLFVRERLIDGVTLSELTRMEQGLPWRRVLALAAPLAHALVAVKKAGVVHGYLGPQRVMLDVAGAPFLLGWRIARPHPDAAQPRRLVLTRTGESRGAVYFDAPEQLRVRPRDYPIDVYRLCVTVYYALTNRLLFSGQTSHEVYRKILEAPLPDPRVHAPDVPEDLAIVLARGLARDPAQRPTAEQLVEGFEAILAGEPLPVSCRARRRWLGRAWLAVTGQ